MIRDYTKEYIKRQIKKKILFHLVTKLFLPLCLLMVILISLIFLVIMLSQNQDVNKHKEQQSLDSGILVNGGIVQNPRSEYADNEVPKEFKNLYKNIANKYDIEWELLAAIHRVETAFSSNNNISTAGAIGHTQFMKCTWGGWSYTGCRGTLGNAQIPKEVYTDPQKIKQFNGEGVDGNGNGKADPMEISDALSATAKKLKKDGANSNISKAIFSYNHSNEYVAKVTKHYKAYKDNVSFVTAGISDIDNLGNIASGGAEQLKGDNIGSPVSKELLSRVTCKIGGYRGHPGIDIGLSVGTPLYAIKDGTVTEVVDHFTTGGASMLYMGQENKVTIKLDNSNLYANYRHLKAKGVTVNVGDKVKAGQRIGYSGNTGFSSGPHLHLDVLKDNKYKISHANDWFSPLKKKYKVKEQGFGCGIQM